VTVRLPAARAHPTGAPRVGDVYWVDTDACYGGNKKPTRPVVVVRAPNEPLLTDAIVMTRTSMDQIGAPHVKHPADIALGLDRNGLFVTTYQRRIDARFLANPVYASFQGVLPEQILVAVAGLVGL